MSQNREEKAAQDKARAELIEENARQGMAIYEELAAWCEEKNYRIVPLAIGVMCLIRSLGKMNPLSVKIAQDISNNHINITIEEDGEEGPQDANDKG